MKIDGQKINDDLSKQPLNFLNLSAIPQLEEEEDVRNEVSLVRHKVLRCGFVGIKGYYILNNFLCLFSFYQITSLHNTSHPTTPHHILTELFGYTIPKNSKAK